MTEQEYLEYVGFVGDEEPTTLDKASDIGNWIGGLLVLAGLALFVLR